MIGASAKRPCVGGRIFCGLAALLAVVSFFGTRSAQAVEEAEAASGPPFNIAVFVSTRTDACYESGNVAAIKRLTNDVQARLNRSGGISGRPVNVTIFDDERDEKKAVDNVRNALADPRLLALVGMSGSSRPKVVFETLGEDIKKSGVPFLSDISDNGVFAKFDNVYTLRASQEDDRVPIMVGFPRNIGYKRPAFIGIKDNEGSKSLSEDIQKELAPAVTLTANLMLGVTNDELNADDATTAAAEIRTKDPDLVYLGFGGDNAARMMSQMVSTGFTPALFLTGNIEMLPAEILKSYPNAVYALAWDRPPEVSNNRIRSYLAQQDPRKWLFEGAKNDRAPGWAKGDCKEREQVEFPDVFALENMRAITTGSQFADMVALVTEAARTGEKTTDIVRLRKRILDGLKNTYTAGRGVFKGSFDNWSFVPGARSAARNPFVIIHPQGLGRLQLAPLQFSRTKDGKLRQMETLYADVDLISVNAVDENEKTFQAEFYLSLRNSEAASIDAIEFSNAYLETKGSGGRQIAIETLHPGGASVAYPESMKIYKVTGRFLFEPHLQNYPFDIQRFAIDIRPKDSNRPFIVQPPPLDLRDKLVDTDGWEARSQYVGFEQDFVPVVDAFTHAPSVVPFYKSSFGWQMQRQTTDYLLRVAVPLGFILFVAYLSIFIPLSHFEAIVTIQVTALLSAVALYLSLPQLDSDTATLSDRAFVFAYMILSMMIGISILRISPLVSGKGAAERALELVHVVAMPIFVALALYFGYQASLATF